MTTDKYRKAEQMFNLINERTNFHELVERPEWSEIKSLIVCSLNALRGIPDPEAYVKAFEKMRAALDEIKNGKICHRCEGNGRMWADGKAHYYDANRKTIACGHCAGEGRVPSFDSVDIERVLSLANQATGKEKSK